MRVKRGVKARRRRNRMLEHAKGFRGRSKNTIRQATQRVEKALTYVYRDRRVKKREFRKLWISRLNACAREHNISYSQLINGLNKANIEIDRKILSELGLSAPQAFSAIVDTAREAAQAELN